MEVNNYLDSANLQNILDTANRALFFSQLLANFVVAMGSILIKDTTREERIKIVQRALNQCGTGCETCSSCWLGGGSVDDIYDDYIEGKREIAEINRDYSRRHAGRQKG